MLKTNRGIATVHRRRCPIKWLSMIDKVLLPRCKYGDGRAGPEFPRPALLLLTLDAFEFQNTQTPFRPRPLLPSFEHEKDK